MLSLKVKLAKKSVGSDPIELGNLDLIGDEG